LLHAEGSIPYLKSTRFRISFDRGESAYIKGGVVDLLILSWIDMILNG